jgi:DNA repair photolyase
MLSPPESQGMRPRRRESFNSFANLSHNRRRVNLPIYEAPVRGILSATSGYIREAGFTHSLTPARNCTFGCTYCYVPTMGIYGGLKPDDWRRWGQFTTFKQNAPELLRRELRPDQVIYCSPLVDPYQPAEAEVEMMPQLLEALIASPPARFVIQTRGALVVRDIDLLKRLRARVSFSLTTNDESVRRLYEPHCDSLAARLDAIAQLRKAGIEVHATLAPLLPCDPVELARLALDATSRDLIGDSLHVRSVKPRGATTRDAAWRIAEHHPGHARWFDREFMDGVYCTIANEAAKRERKFLAGPAGFRLLTEP